MMRLTIIIFAFILALGLVIVGIFTSAANDLFSLQWGNINFFEVHGFVFLIFMGIFPRLTLLFSSVSTGGILWWIGWLVAPRFLVAILATFAYLQTNPFLVALAWVFVFAGEGGEKYYMYKKASGARQNFSNEDSIEVEFKRK